MKSIILSALSVLLVIGFSGFSGKSHSSAHMPVAGKKSSSLTYFMNDAWIASTYDFQACSGQHYSVRDAAPGDTFHWYVIWDDWTRGTTDYGTGDQITEDFSPGDEIMLVVNEGTPDEYYYYNTLVECGG